MRQTRIYILEFIIAFCACLTLYFLTDHEKDLDKKDYVEWNDEAWTVLDSAGNVLVSEYLPSDIECEDGRIILKRVLRREECEDNRAMVFLTVHNDVNVWVEGNIIFSLDSKKVNYSKSYGHNWCSVDMLTDYAGKELQIEFLYPYQASHIRIPKIYLGNAMEITSDYVRKNLNSFMISLFMGMMGTLLLIVYFFLGRKKHMERRLMWLGWFAVSFGIWSITETNVLTLWIYDTLFLGQLAFISLKLSFTPVIMFYQDTFPVKYPKFLNGLCLASFVDLIGTSVLQMLGILDYKETILVTHIYMVVGVLYVLISFILYVVNSRKDSESVSFIRSKMSGSINAIGITLVASCVFVDFLRYYFSKVQEDAARYSRIGLLGYILVLGMRVIKDSLHLLDVEKEAQQLKEEAFQDPVTHLANRAAFDRDISEITAEMRTEYGIIMCDLNGLKYFNDHYGHSMGDSYIFIAAEVLCDTYRSYGKTYRIGGDEFVVLAKNMDEETYKRIYAEMNVKIDSLSKTCFDERMGIASGYAIFDPSKDFDLSDTEKRADERMYQTKKEMKSKNEKYRRDENAQDVGVQVANPILKK